MWRLRQNRNGTPCFSLCVVPFLSRSAVNHRDGEIITGKRRGGKVTRQRLTHKVVFTARCEGEESDFLSRTAAPDHASARRVRGQLTEGEREGREEEIRKPSRYKSLCVTAGWGGREACGGAGGEAVDEVMASSSLSRSLADITSSYVTGCSRVVGVIVNKCSHTYIYAFMHRQHGHGAAAAASSAK